MQNHPRLYVTREQINRAKERVNREEWAKAILTDHIQKADAVFTIELPVYETEWWQETKKKHWNQFYPEIHRHCSMVPGPPVNAAHAAALAYLFTGKEKYADRAKEILLHTTAFSFEFEHPDVGMLYTSLGLSSIQAYDMLFDHFNSTEQAKMREFFDRAYQAVKKNDDWWIETNPGGLFNNHFAWHKLWIGVYGLYFGKDDLLTYAIDSEQGVRELMEHGLLDDGVWFESSLNYHFAAVWALLKLAHMLRNCNHKIDLYTHEFANGRNLKQLFDGILLNAFPDTSLPPIGDAYGNICHLSKQSFYYGTAFSAYEDPTYEWLLVKGEKRDIDWLFRKKIPVKGSAPAVYTQLFPEHGHAILRSKEGSGYWDSDCFAAFFSYDINNIHSHRDKLDLILFGQGKLLLCDPEAKATAPHAFSSQVQKELNRTSICHNTVIVDGQEQGSISEKLTLLEFKNLPGVKTVSAGDLDGRVYPGVRMKRTVSVTDDYVVDVFQVESEKEHSYQWLLHPCDDEGRTRTTVDLKPTELPDKSPWTWLRNPRGVKLDGDFHAEWVQDDLVLRLTLLGDKNTNITICDFPRFDTFEKPFLPMVIAERKGKSATYIALYQAERKQVPDAQFSAKPDKHNMLRVTVTIKGKTQEHLIGLL